MNVFSFSEFKYRDTVAVLRSILRRAMMGEIFGVAICVLSKDGEDYAFTGRFREDSARALKAANRISWKMNQALDAEEFAASVF